MTAPATRTAFIDFNSLTFEQQKQHFEDVARKALPVWGYPAESNLKLLNITENATYKVESENKPVIIMRVHRLAYAQRTSIKTELSWIMSLKDDTDLNLATCIPYQGRHKKHYVKTIETPEMNERRNVVCFSFESGKAPVDSHDDNESIGKIAGIFDKIPNRVSQPLFKLAANVYDRFTKSIKSMSQNTLTDGDKATYRKLGEIAAKIHRSSKTWEAPPFYNRIEWDFDATFAPGWNNFYGAHYRDLDILSEKDKEAIDSAAFLIEKRLKAYGKDKSRYGMIHSDLRMSNLLDDKGKITVLDFDDCGRGWYMYDIASIVGFMEHRPDLGAIIDEILKGYSSVITLTRDDINEIPTFIMMRRIGLLQAMIYHISNTQAGEGESAELTPETLAFYAEGTVVMARRYAKNYANVPFASAPAAEKEAV